MKDYLDQLRAELAEKNPLYVQVKIIPQAPKTEIVEQMDDGTYKVKVAAMPLKGQANLALCKFLKKALDLQEAVIVTGGRDSRKLLRLSRKVFS